MNAPYLKHAPLNRHAETMEACRQPSDSERLSGYMLSLSSQFDQLDHQTRAQAGTELKKRLAEHWQRRDEAANEH